jgi:hypothetical protein
MSYHYTCLDQLSKNMKLQSINNSVFKVDTLKKLIPNVMHI